MRRRFLFNRVVESVYVYKYTTTDGQMLSLSGVNNHTYEDGVGSFEKNSKTCVKFGYQPTLESVFIPEGITRILSESFYECLNLTNIEIPNSVTNIDNMAFAYCSCLSDIAIPNSVTSIGYGAFSGCTGIKSIVIPNSVTSIGERAFQYCSGLSSIVIGNGVIHIGNEAFYNCSGLTSIIVENGNPIYDSRNNCNAIINTAENVLLYGCQNTVIFDSVTSISQYAFYDCDGLTSITIPNSVTWIGHQAFYGCTGLKTVINFSNLTFSKGSWDNGYVAYYADKVVNAPGGFVDGDFAWIENEDGMTLAGYLGGATELTLPADYKGENYVIGADVFKDNTVITSVTIPNSVTSIGYDAFSGCTRLEKVCINDLAAWCGIDFGSADANPLYYAKNLYLNGELLTELVIPDNVTNIRDYVFNYCTRLTSVTIPNSVTSIGFGAFYNCKGLTRIDIGNNVTTIEHSAFSNCTSLTSIMIPNSVTNIKMGAFLSCTSLKELHFEDGENTLYLGHNAYTSSGTGKGLFYDCPLQTLYLGRNLSYEIGSSYGYSPFYNQYLLSSVTFGNSVTHIGDSIFRGCSDILNIIIPDNITTIKSYAFKECTGLASITIGNGVTSIEESAFWNCSDLKTVYNYSSLNLVKGSSDYGYVAHYADEVINM